jgi:hypothetical protein
LFDQNQIKMETLSSNYLESIRKQFLYYKKLADQSIHRLNGEQLRWQFNPESNSIAIIMRHIAGNLHSRFTDFLTSDGEKPWRNRDQEFEAPLLTYEELVDYWEHGWRRLFEAIDLCKSEDLERLVYIRNEGHTIMEACNRQLAHYPYHIGQIVYIARMIQGDAWQSLSIPKNQSTSYNQEKFDQEKGRRHFTDGV